MHVLPHPLLGIQKIRMRRDMWYGEHDPCVAPQPFNIRSAHLCCIQHPDATLTHLNDIFWLLPDETDFLPLDNNASSIPLGFINENLVALLESACRKMRQDLASLVTDRAPSSALSDDSKIKDYRGRIKYLLDHLRLPATFEEARMIWRLVQRVSLELDARILWVDQVERVYSERSAQRCPTRNVVGALVENFDLAERLWRVGFFFTATFVLLTL